MTLASGVLAQPGLLVPFALVQLTVLLLLVRALDLFERKPLGLVALMALVGATAAPILALSLRPAVEGWIGTGGTRRQAVLAAITEEPAKALCVLALFAACMLLADRIPDLEFDGVTDGMVYGAAVGLGFAFTENLFYLIGQADLAQGLSVFSARTDFFGIRILSHAVYTAYFGAGLGFATWQRNRALRLVYPLVGLAVGVTTHAAHNVLALKGNVRPVRLVDYLLILAALAAMAVWLGQERAAITEALAQERAAGLPLGDGDVALASSYGSAARRELAAFRAGDAQELRRLRRLRQALVRLALSQWRHGRTGAVPMAVAAHRVEVSSLLRKPVLTVHVPVTALQAATAAIARRQDDCHEGDSPGVRKGTDRRP